MSEVRLTQDVNSQAPLDEEVNQPNEQAIIKELALSQLQKLAELYFTDEKRPNEILHSDDNIDSKWRHAWFARLVGHLDLMIEENFIRDRRLIRAIRTTNRTFTSTKFKKNLTELKHIALANQTIRAVCEYFDFPLNPVAV